MQVVLSSQGEAVRPEVQAGRQLVMQRRVHTGVSPASAATAGHQGWWRLTNAGARPCACQRQAGLLPESVHAWGRQRESTCLTKARGLARHPDIGQLAKFPKGCVKVVLRHSQGQAPCRGRIKEVMPAHTCTDPVDFWDWMGGVTTHQHKAWIAA